MLASNRKHRILWWGLFIGYLIVITYFMFFSDGFGRSDHEGYAYNLIFFKEIKRFYKYRELLGMKSFLLNIVGNVVCFMPFGFILPLISRRGGKWYNTFLLSFLFSFGIETLQLVWRVGSFDVDDMFLNTLGGILGYIGVVFVKYVWRKHREKKSEAAAGR